MSSAFVPIGTSTNVILYNSSLNKKLILYYILNRVLCVFAIFSENITTFKAIA